MKWTRKDLLSLFPSHRGAEHEISINEVFIDSRKSARHALFVPIVGETFDGHDFLLDAIQRGAVAALWQKNRDVPGEVPLDFPLFFVDDTLEGLQRFARQYLRRVHPKVIAVTGSNGKTTTKDMIECVAATRFLTHKTKGNFNNHIGMPLTILEMPENCEMLILEMGMNHFGEISFLSQLAEPDLAVITNIGESHIEFLGSREGIAKAKMEIADGLKADGKLIFDGDEPLLDSLRSRPSLSCGFTERNDLQVTLLESKDTSMRFTLNDENCVFELPVFGKHNVKNAAYAIAVGREAGVSDAEMAKAIKTVKLTAMRFQQVQGEKGTLLINDAYNASPTSMKASIQAVKALPRFRRRVLVLGDMHELGAEERSLHESVADSIEAPITDVVTIGSRARWIAEAVKNVRVQSVDDKEAAAEVIEPMLSNDTVILFKASRAVSLEALVERFSV
ncbi:MAG TPA: UDP-N-acetylmuramoyl-tripeptide--D-alanyl-D-alanine ligase [Bacillales bacterium]|nr:UDP-N-acetylmuramoyl-tripeptide--D-alanyl-D-alanine ligase [Bacillales bacterium]